MENLSRELEGHLKKFSKSGGAKKKNRNSLFFIDDFGRIKPADWIWQAVVIMGFVSLFSTIAALSLLYSHTGLKLENNNFAKSLDSAERRIDSLIDEKEILMARLVISGSTTGDLREIPEEKAMEKDALESETVDVAKETETSDDMAEDSVTEPTPAEIVEDQKLALGPEKDVQESKKPVQIIDIEAFKVEKDAEDGDLLVTFDVRKTTGKSGTIAGHVFVILKPDPRDDTDWVVLPSVFLENEKPVLPNQGQFFSIVHFKPVRFRIKSQADPGNYKAASILIYNSSDDKLILQKDITISESPKSPI